MFAPQCKQIASLAGRRERTHKHSVLSRSPSSKLVAGCASGSGVSGRPRRARLPFAWKRHAAVVQKTPPLGHLSQLHFSAAEIHEERVLRVSWSLFAKPAFTQRIRHSAPAERAARNPAQAPPAPPQRARPVLGRPRTHSWQRRGLTERLLSRLPRSLRGPTCSSLTERLQPLSPLGSGHRVGAESWDARRPPLHLEM